MYRVINATVIFDIFWSLISFGHGEGLPTPGRDSPIDSVDDFFRVRLVCTLLETCGACFDRGSSKRKLDQFLVVFQVSSLAATWLTPALHSLQVGDPHGRRLYAK
jgi:regulator of nonsense transcripts 2